VCHEWKELGSFQCRVKDDNKSIAYAGQTAYANHCMLLQSKVVVVNNAAKGYVQHSQVRVRKLNANEPLMKCPNGSLSCKSTIFELGCVIHCNG
jgi:hypothetical protein